MIIRPYLLPKRPLSSQLLDLVLNKVIFVEMKILQTLRRLEADTEMCSGKWTLLKCREVLNDYKSEQNSLKNLEGAQLCRKLNSTSSNFQVVFLPFKNICFKENLKGKSKKIEIQCISYYSRCIALHFDLLQLVRLTDRCSTFFQSKDESLD